jgi:L-phenylalanine/L-methionine N-acetyltransferase
MALNDAEPEEHARSQTSRGLVIRAWTVADAESMAALANLPGYRFGTLRMPYETAEAWRKRIAEQGPGNLGLVAELDGRIVGSAGLQRLAGRRIHCASVGMGVHDDFRRRGIGRALAATLTEAADRWLGIRRLELTVYADNEAAIRLYSGFGFGVEGRMKDFAFRDGAYVDALAMARLV